MNKKLRISLESVIIIILMLFLFVGCIFAYWLVRPNTAQINSQLEMETWNVETNYNHNAFTDMLHWNGKFYLSFRVASSHGDTVAKILVLESEDAKNWQINKEFYREGRDIRDPKMAVINDYLFIYVISALSIDHPTTTTFYSFTEDGNEWTDLVECEPQNKRWWRPKTHDGATWYCPVFRDERVDLYKTSNGIDWQYVSIIQEGPGADETDFAFGESGQIIASMRIQSDSIIGDNERSTLICISDFPYNQWTYYTSEYNRLDGPSLFRINEKTYAAGRFQPELDVFMQQVGNALGKKRTSLFVFNDNEMIYLTDLPSSGDTSYPAAVILGDYLFLSYYTCDASKDYPWFLGMISDTKVKIAKIKISSLENLTNGKIENQKTSPVSFPWLDYVFILSLIAIETCFTILITKKRIRKL